MHISRLTEAVTEQKGLPELYKPFFEPLLPHLNRSREREPAHVLMTRTVLDPDAGLFNLLLTLLRTSPLFVTSVAWRTGSSVTDPRPQRDFISFCPERYAVSTIFIPSTNTLHQVSS